MVGWKQKGARDARFPKLSLYEPARAKTMTDDTPALLRLTRPFRRVHIVPMALHVLPGPFTRDAYHRLAELGVLDEDDRVELLDGQIVEMTPIGGAHAACVNRLNALLSRPMGSATCVSVQNPVVLSERWEPLPDLAVLRRAGGFTGAWLPCAQDVLFVIEVADTSLERDRDVKIPRYAAAGIPEAWLVDLAADDITVYRGPGPDGYRNVITVTRGDTLRPLLLTDVTIGAADILG